MGNFRASSIIFTVMFIYLLPTLSLNSPTPNRIVTKLIYRNSVNSPYFHQTTSEERENRDMDNSLTQSKQMKVEGDITELDFHAPIISRRSSPLFLVRFEMGEPPIPQTVALDTGSSLFWVHCAGIGGDYALEKKYYPGESSTYSELVNCDKYCVGTRLCMEEKPCDYFLSYATGWSKGTLATERFIFRSFYGNDSITYDDIMFGCADDAKNIAKYYNGILGLGAAKYSILPQVGSNQFSYCIGNLSDPSYDENVLLVGEKLEVGGDSTLFSTPLLIQGNHYFTNLEGISFGGKMLDIDKKRLRRSSDYKGGALFDSGASYSVLQSVAYNKLEEEIVEFIGDSLEETNYPGNFNKLCYVGNLYTDFIDFPVVTFHFANNAEMELDKDNLFQQIGDIVCLNVVDAAEIKSIGFDCSIIGVNLQQYFYLAYDLNSKQLSFKRMGCEDLWDDYW